MFSTAWLWILKHPRIVTVGILALIIAGLYWGMKHYKHEAADLQAVVAVQKAEIKQAGQAITASVDHQDRIGQIASVTRATARRIERATQEPKTQSALNSEAVAPEKRESQPKVCPEVKGEDGGV